MSRTLKNGVSEDRGAAIVLLSVLMVLLLGVAAFAVDLGWFLLNSSRLQRAADSAALHGVTYLPGFASDAQTAAEESSQANGFPTSNTSVSTAQVAPGQLEVTLSTQVDTFFLKVFGMDSATITRQATAEYVKPVPMGGDTSWFGNGSGSGPGSDQRFWAAIQGEFTNRLHGDPYTTSCGPWPDRPEVSPPGMTCGGNTNSTYRADGYWLVVDVPVGNSGNVNVGIFSAGFNPGPSDPRDIATGDSSGIVDAMTTTFSVFDVDLTPFDPTDNPPYAGGSCVLTAPPGTNSGNTGLCTLVNPTPGLYPIHVTSSGGEGSNQFLVKANGGPGIQVYGINDISIWTTVTGSARIPLAEIVELHAGKKLLLSFYDPGDASGLSSVTIVTPSGADASCTWRTDDTQTGVIGPTNSANPCRITTTLANGTRLFNGVWIRMEIDIPTDYVCGADCWWSVDYNLTGATDRTVWEARVIGNPVRLVIGAGSG